MVNKYLTAMNKAYSEANWDERLSNKNGTPLTDGVDDILNFITETGKTKAFVIFSETKYGKARIYESSFKKEFALSEYNKRVIALFTNDVCINLGATNRDSYFKQACVFLDVIGCDFHDITQSKFDKHHAGLSIDSQKKVNQFIKYLVSNGFCMHLAVNKAKGKAVRDADERAKKKLPADISLKILSAHFAKAFPEDKKEWDTDINTNQDERILLAMFAIAMSAPKRAAAEIPTMMRQNVQITEHKGKNQHALFWHGSKGYDDNLKHVLEQMAPYVQRALDFFELYTQPYRILARFWQDQSLTINELFINPTESQKTRISSSGLNQNKPISIIQLAYLIGIIGKTICTATPKESGTERTFKYEYRSAAEFDLDAHVYVIPYKEGIDLSRLFGLKAFTKNCSIHTIGRLPLYFQGDVKTFQQHIYKLLMAIFPSFPISTNATNKVPLESAVWVLPRTWGPYGQGKSSVILRNSSELSYDFNQLLKSFWEYHSYPKELRITPNQLRHYLNDYGNRNGISDPIMNAFSGRADTRHIEWYLHESDQDTLARMPNKRSYEEQAESNISVSSMKKYSEMKGKGGVATMNATGFCIQNLMYEPCDYLNDFIGQCIFCEQSCHIAHDKESIDFLKKDCEVQTKRLEQFRKAKAPNEHAKNWYKVHSKNTFVLNELINVMEDETIPKGSVIRVIIRKQEIRIADLKTQKISIRKLQLTNMEEDIKSGIKALTVDPNCDVDSKKNDDGLDFLNFL